MLWLVGSGSSKVDGRRCLAKFLVMGGETVDSEDDGAEVRSTDVSARRDKVFLKLC